MVHAKEKNKATATGRAPRFLLAMPDDLRHALEKSALAVGRPLTTEINRRLQESLDRQVDLEIHDTEGRRTYLEFKTGGGKSGAGFSPAALAMVRESDDIEQQLARLVDQLPIEKKIALYNLLK